MSTLQSVVQQEYSYSVSSTADLSSPGTAESRDRRWRDRAWRASEVIVASCALFVLAPVMSIIAVAVKMTSPGPALFRQQRIGLNGNAFLFYKFRTMRVGVDDTALRDQIARELRGEDTSRGGSWKLADDQRVTSLGSFLRRHSLDELPQLINVFLGHMSLVGPRPCLEWEAEMFAVEFGERFAVRPGLTGLWQVSGRSTMGTRDMLALDVEYAKHQTLRGDLGILAKTLPALLRIDGAR